MDSKERFSNRVDSYVKFRPTYPVEALDYLDRTVGMSPRCTVADIGAGTGIFTELLLDRGIEVAAVEPNPAMREAAESWLGGRERVRFVAGSAEETGLPGDSVDIIVCAQAFHWFDRAAAQIEFRRVLKPGGKVVLIWNSRLTQGTPFLEGYEHLLRAYANDYKEVQHKNISPDVLALFFKEGSMKVARFSNRQEFDFEGLKGRLLSSSYAPLPGQPNHKPMMAELQQLFDRTETEGKVSFDYETEVFWGEV